MQRLLYCSESTLDSVRAADEISSIISSSKARNAAQGISGALISTNRYFAQALEGEAASVEHLMQSIIKDARHRRVTIVDKDCVRARRFATWNMAYRGYANYVNSPIEVLLTARSVSEKAVAVGHIYDLMIEFAKPQGNVNRFSVPIRI